MNARQQILLEHFRAIHQQGFQTTRTDRVVAQMGITKGAFYHYFPTKNHLGYALLDEIICPLYIGIWAPFAAAESDHQDVLRKTLDQYKGLVDTDSVRWGCVLTNLIQEMAPIDTGFQERLTGALQTMQEMVTKGLRNGQLAGNFRGDLQAEQAATFLLASLQGVFSMAKGAQSMDVFNTGMSQLAQHLETWKP